MSEWQARVLRFLTLVTQQWQCSRLFTHCSEGEKAAPCCCFHLSPPHLSSPKAPSPTTQQRAAMLQLTFVSCGITLQCMIEILRSSFICSISISQEYYSWHFSCQTFRKVEYSQRCDRNVRGLVSLSDR